MAYHVHIAENDDYGTPQGWAERIEVEDFMLENTLMGGRSPKVSFDGKRLIIGSLSCEATRSRCAGNICWNLYYVSWADAMDIVNYLMKLKYWTCNEGPCEQADKFDKKQPFTHSDMQAIFSRDVRADGRAQPPQQSSEVRTK